MSKGPLTDEELGVEPAHEPKKKGSIIPYLIGGLLAIILLGVIRGASCGGGGDAPSQSAPQPVVQQASEQAEEAVVVEAEPQAAPQEQSEPEWQYESEIVLTDPDPNRTIKVEHRQARPQPQQASAEPQPEPQPQLRVAPERTGGGYNRDNWHWSSDRARRNAGCASGQHLDHIVALKEAWESGGASWTPERKSQFASDADNHWCLLAGANLSKGARDVAEWGNWGKYLGCEQRLFIATKSRDVKLKYDLAVDQFEQAALDAIIGEGC